MLTGRTASIRGAGLLRYGLAVFIGLAGIAVLAWFLLRDARSGPSEAEVVALLQARPGGDTTIATTNRNSFGLAAPNLTNAERRVFEVGDSFFTQNWVTAPASTEARDGLGPTFNAQSCSSCHTLDGRAKPPDHAEDPERGLLFRLSIPGADPTTGGPVAGCGVWRPTAGPGDTHRPAGGAVPDHLPGNIGNLRGRHAVHPPSARIFLLRPLPSGPCIRRS